ncbi:MAG: von Willebrand factor type A domain-containing protein [Bacteroidales bacterium]|nr:von Willebrand factor type A domain-containing protein [Bacteroidales bacterium]
MKTLFLILMLMTGVNFLNNTDRGTVSGVVKDELSGLPINNVAVGAVKSGRLIGGAITNAQGTFSFGIPTGIYELRLKADGYQDKIIRNIRVEKDRTNTLQITLAQDVPVPVEVSKDEAEAEDVVTAMEIGRNNRAVSRTDSYMPAGGGYYDYDEPYVEHNTESYDVINENIFKEVVNNPLSTFSVDVDRASYSNVRRFLSNNQKPPVDAVRIEEFINYFDYDYPQPNDGHPFSVTIESDVCPWNETHGLVLIGLKGENINENEIPANNLVFLIDVSGSMGETNKLPLVKQSLKFLVEQLRPQDKVAIVVYAGAAGLVLESTQGSNKNRITAAIDNLESGGSTAGGAGIRLAYKVAKENFIPSGNNRVILASDGDFNVGASSDAEMVRLIEEKRDDGVFLTVLGFGMGNYKDSKFEVLSNAGNGNYFYIDNILEAKKVFGVELWGTLYTIAKDVKIQVEFNPAKVKAYRLLGYENRILNNEDFNNDKKDAGDIGCGHTVTALYEVILAGSDEVVPSVDPLRFQNVTQRASNDYMNVKIRYKKPNEDISNLIEKSVREGQIRGSNNLLFASSIAELGMLMRDSEFKANASFNSLIERAKRSKGTDEYGFRSDFIKMAEIAELLYK